VTDILLGLTRKAYLALVVDEDDQFVNLNGIAQKVWNYYESRVRGIPEKRIGLPPLAELRKRERDQLLDPKSGWLSARSIAILRTKLNLPAAAAQPAATQPAAATNAPSAALGP
jgi:hypothetical protein